ncbi:MAG: lysostaphin resistance A-like protein [Anaerolineales bacterium]
MQFFAFTNRLFELARTAKRLPHIVLALPLAVAFVFAAQLIGGVPLLLVFVAVFGDKGIPHDAPFVHGLAVGAILIASFGFIFVLLWAWLKWFEKRPFWTLGFERDGALMKYGRGLLIGLAQFALVMGAPALFGWVAPEPGREQFEGWLALGGVLVITLGWAVQGAAEETLTRGWLMNVIGARYRPWLGVLVSSALFGVLHLLNSNVGLLPFINLCLFGLFAALYALWEGGLWGIAAQHAVWNWAQGNVFGMQVSGNDDAGPILWNLQETGPDLLTGGAFGPEGGLAVTVMLVVSIAVLAVLLRKRATIPVT